jgi:uncharacterized protein YpiB (UPF0302 family)
METQILTAIHFVANRESLKRRLRIRENGSNLTRFLALIKESQKIAQPKAMYRPVYIEDRSEKAVKVEGR